MAKGKRKILKQTEKLVFWKENGQYYLCRYNGKYKTNEIMDNRLILEAHDSWMDDLEEKGVVKKKHGTISLEEITDDFFTRSQDSLDETASQDESARCKSTSKKEYGPCTVDEVTEEFFKTDELPKKQKDPGYDIIEDLKCGFGDHDIAYIVKPIKVRTEKGESYVCYNCRDSVPKNMFMKKLEETAEELSEKGVKGKSMSQLGYVKPRFESIKKIASDYEHLFSPITDFLKGFSVCPQALFIASTIAKNWGNDVKRVNTPYTLGLWTGGAVLATGLIASGAVFLTGSPEAVVLIGGANIADGIYEFLKPEKFNPVVVEDEYARLHELLLMSGYEVARRKHTENFPYGITIALDGSDNMQAVKMLVGEQSRAYRVKSRQKEVELAKDRFLLNVGFTPLVKKY